MAGIDVRVRVNPAALKQMASLTDDAMGEFADLMADHAREEVPKVTRNLMRSIRAMRDAPMMYRVVTEGTGYGAYVELGTSRHPTPNPFLQRAFRRAQKTTFGGGF